MVAKDIEKINSALLSTDVILLVVKVINHLDDVVGTIAVEND